MNRILISACLVGLPVRYNGTAKIPRETEIVARWQREGRLVLLCPEVAVGFPTPRPPAEIAPNETDEIDHYDGAGVLVGKARVIENVGRNVSDLYVKAAFHTVEFAKQHGCSHAVLTDGSPSCGSTFIYDGTFSGTTRRGFGTTTAALREANISVWPETAIKELDALLRS